MELDNKTGMKVVRRKLTCYELDEVNIGSNAMPLLEVFSVIVNSSMFSNDCEIYGTIKATNGLGHVFDLYNRKRNNPEFIEPSRGDGYTRYLSLTGLKDGRVIIPYDYVVMEVDLRDRARGDVVIAKGKLSLNYKETFYTEHGAEIVRGEPGLFVTVHYATFPYAVTASVDVFFFKKDDDYDIECGDIVDWDQAIYDSFDYGYDDGVDVYGTVAAHTNFPGSVSYGDSTSISSILLKLSQDECVRVKSRSSVKLSRSMVAVPVNSSSPFQVYVDFKYKDGSRLAYGVLEFLSLDICQFKSDLVGENGRIRVRVTWGDAYEQRYRGSDLKRCCFNEESNPDELVKRQRFLADPQPSSFSCDDRSRPTLLARIKEEPVQLVEVFSIVVGSNDLKPPFKLYGDINVQGSQYFHLFNRDENSPLICFDKIEVKYTHNRGILAKNDFGIYVDLKDAEGNVFVDGFVTWTFRFFDKWYNKRICSFIRGDHGYIALHYMIIEDGIQAELNVLVKSNDSALNLLPAKFYGSIVAQYSNYEYSTSYDEKYYQSILFEKSLDDPVNHLEDDGSLPLSKSLVSVPKQSSLIIIKVDLTCLSSADVDLLQGSAEFNSDGQSFAEIRGKNYSIDILVTWSQFRW